VPIVALLLWPLRDILPWDFQYLGLIFALNCVLQLYFGYRISWLLAGHSRLIAIAGALLFLVAPPFVFRSSGHFPLTSHWLILAALILYFTSSAAPTKWRLAAGAALCFLAATIHAYIIVMVLLIDTGAHLRAAMSSKEVAGASLGARLYWIGLRVGISLASAIAGLIIFGLLRPLELRAYAEGGYGAFSMNLLAPIDPGNFGALVLKPQPQVGILQYEGYNYLGLGVILLGTLALALRPSLFVRNLCRREAAATWLICAVSLFLALSLKATVGSWTIYDISVPLPVFEALSAFRASGRFFWPAYYLLLCGVITLAFAAFGRRWAALALSCVVDSGGGYPQSLQLHPSAMEFHLRAFVYRWGRLAGAGTQPRSFDRRATLAMQRCQHAGRARQLLDIRDSRRETEYDYKQLLCRTAEQSAT
jgi:hypothetical protein